MILTNISCELKPVLASVAKTVENMRESPMGQRAAGAPARANRATAC
jgi:hypothetical protein